MEDTSGRSNALKRHVLIVLIHKSPCVGRGNILNLNCWKGIHSPQPFSRTTTKIRVPDITRGLALSKQNSLNSIEMRFKHLVPPRLFNWKGILSHRQPMDSGGSPFVVARPPAIDIAGHGRHPSLRAQEGARRYIPRFNQD